MIVFPIGIVRFVRWVAPMLILPAASTFNLEEKKRAFEKNPANIELEDKMDGIKNLHEMRDRFLRCNKNAEPVSITTEDGVELDTIKIESPSSNKWIIYFHGNDMCYEQALEDLKVISQRTGANVYTGNYRGVMRSCGKMARTHDLILDGKALVKQLLEEGVLQENILIHGFSLGGAIATDVAALYPKVHLCNERSFASLMDFLKGHLSLFGVFLGAIAWFSGFKFSAAKNFEKIQGEKLVMYHQQDKVIRYKGSMHKVLENQKVAHKPYEMTFEASNHHCEPLISQTEAFNAYVHFVKEALSLT
jgi:esterase/lipase